MTRFEKISVLNIFATLMLSVIAVILSYNSYKISENTFLLAEKVETISLAQAKNELKSAASAMFTIISMLRQSDADGKNLGKSIQALTEMRDIVESQLKNSFLAQNKEISESWVELYSRLTFYIKFFEEGQNPHSSVGGVKDILLELDNKTNTIHAKIQALRF